ncbi:sigma-54-dependent transcriptional regulator [Gilvimarinus algae]|uniref:Sigma-54 dependent transcriptional regulator n=1 Tax=Gilvimarinus algae TaxID=3058037 RepID=A0ABT8TK69_9GAMM|nr:sigma-54 dependent transcriptional regulator [Gilvimarinus sp. SDUM040014]MDO3383503.1 sigma-54 dependent transcriptional regulator [Gilvimarinus sp. SDUM040014]
MAKILLVDDDQSFLEATSELLGMLGHSVSTAESVAQAREVASGRVFDHVILDLILPDGSGLHVLDELEARAATNVTLVTGHPSVKSIVKDLYGPNISYLIKPIDLQQLQSLLDRPVAVEPVENLPGLHFGHLVGESAPMQKLYEMIDRVAGTQANVMLMGESGVGKEVVAAAIHQASKPAGAFVPANCGAFARDLIASELFGHEKGAFTGAAQRKAGVFELANNGTLFLDEITEMPIDQQPNLLRVLETQKVTRLGATSAIDVNCRVVSATNRTETQLAEQGCLREDLYFRLAVFPIHIPPLRQRSEDIPLLVDYFLADFNRQYKSEVGVDAATLDRLTSYDWPGNVRELRHAVHRAFIMADRNTRLLVLPDDLSSPFSKTGETRSAGISVGKTVEDVERELIETTLEHLDGDKKRAAEMLGISLKTLYNRLNSYAEQ